MIQKFVDRFMEQREQLRAQFQLHAPTEYSEIVKAVVETIVPKGDDYGWPDVERIHQIDDGDYQGTLLFVIGAVGYQPSTYWFVKISYGSCSGCDTLEAIRSYTSDPPTDSQVEDYMTLALHVVQGLKEMGSDVVA